MISVFDYIAENNPSGVQSIFDKYGYSVTNTDPSQLGAALEQVVTEQGDEAFVDMCNIHPDKEMILATCGSTAKQSVNGMMGSVMKGKGMDWLSGGNRDAKIAIYAIGAVAAVYLIAKAAK
jgi:hypothetical protein